MGRSLGLIWLLASPGIVAGQQPLVGPPREAIRPREQPSATAELLDEVRGLRAEVNALRDRPQAAATADVERLRAEVERLAAAERELGHALEERGTTPAPDPPGETTGFPWLVLVVGVVLGWAGSRVAQRRRERRQRGKLWW